MRRAVTAIAAVAAAIVAQMAVVDRLPLPGGSGPDLVLVVVVALALVTGPASGAVIGFAAGLAADVAPPASHLVGQSALVFCLVGYACGRTRALMARPSWLPLGVLAAGVAGGESLYAAAGRMFGDPDITWAAIRQVLPASVAYDLLVSPFILYAVVRLGRYEGWAAGGRPDLLAGPEVAAARAGTGLAAAGGAVRDTRAGRSPRLGAASSRPGDGWIGRQPGASGEAAPWVRRRRPLRLRLRGGAPGSAAAGPHSFAGPPAAGEHRMGRGAFRGSGGPASAGGQGSSPRAGAAKIRAAAFRGGSPALASPRGHGARMRTRAFRGGKSALSAPGWRPGMPALRLRGRRRDGVIGGSVLGRGGLQTGSLSGAAGGPGRPAGGGQGVRGPGGGAAGPGQAGLSAPGGRRMRVPRSGAFSGAGAWRPASSAAFLAGRAAKAGGLPRAIRPAGAAPRFGRPRWGLLGRLAAALPGRRDELDRLGRRGGLGGIGRRRGLGALGRIGRRNALPGRRRGPVPALGSRMGLGRGDGVVGGSVLGPRDALAPGRASRRRPGGRAGASPVKRTGGAA